MTGLSDLATLLDAERMAQGLDRRDLVERLGIHPSGITRAFNYTLTLPMAEKIAAALGCCIVVRLMPAGAAGVQPEPPETP